MKLLTSILAVLILATGSFAQRTSLVGTIYDPNGAVIVGARVDAEHEKGEKASAESDPDGSFSLQLVTGIHKLTVSAPGFISVELSEYLIVRTSQMKMDFVLFGGKYHEPCGYSGADCLPADLLLKKSKVENSPSLKKIRDNFSPETKPSTKRS